MCPGGNCLKKPLEFFHNLPNIYPQIAQGVNWEWFQKFPTTLISIWSQSKLRNCSERTLQFTLQVTLWKNPQSSFTNLLKNAHNLPEPLIESSFTICSAIWPQHTQLHTLWVYWGFFEKLNQTESFLWVNWKKLGEYVDEYIQSNLQKNSQWVAQVGSGHFLSKFMKELWGIKVVGNFWNHSQFTPWAICG